MEKEFSETLIQDALYKGPFAGGHDIYSPNINLYRWESDLLSITKSAFVNEYEIKISKADFKADFKKEEKHYILKNGSRKLKGFEANDYYRPHLRINTVGEVDEKMPNYFWYVCPEDLIKIEDIPDYAGLQYVIRRIKNHDCLDSEFSFRIKIIKKAPRLHKEKISETDYLKIIKSVYFKFWNKRLKNG